ncbi:MAG TPA: tetratricopeptide repeat protein, partial [Spirochaetota bacterium]|nr:tetratricopeptide repeat protein [Spirochaetota bacterium]
QYAYKRYMEYYPDGEKAALAMKRIRGIDAGEPAPPDIGGHDAGPAPAPPKQAEADFSFDEPDQSKEKDMIDFDDSTHEDEAPVPSRSASGGTSLSSEMDDFFADTKAPALDDFDADVTMSDSPRDLNDAADTSFGRGNYPMALEMYQKIISLNRTASPEEKKLYEKAHFDAGRCYIEMGKPKEALDLMSKVLRNFTGSPYLKPAIFHIGMIFESVNQKEKAITYYNKVLNMSPKDKLNSDALTKIKQLQGK